MDALTEVRLKLAQSEEREKTLLGKLEELQDFIENASLPMHWVNGSGIVIWANQAELDLLGYVREEYIGSHISTFHADKKVSENILERLIHKETLRNYPARLVRKNGHIRHVLINSSVFWKNDKFVHTRCFTRDISEIRQLEEQKTELIALLEEKNRRLRTENAQLRNAANRDNNT